MAGRPKSRRNPRKHAVTHGSPRHDIDRALRSAVAEMDERMALRRRSPSHERKLEAEIQRLQGLRPMSASEEAAANGWKSNPRHVGGAMPPHTVLIENNVAKVPGYVKVTHAQVALAQRHAPGIGPMASLVTTDKGGPGRKAKRWYRWFLPESIKAQPWATASIKRRNPAGSALHAAGLEILPTAFGTVAIVTRRAFQGQGHDHPLSGSTHPSAKAARAAFRAHAAGRTRENPAKPHAKGAKVFVKGYRKGGYSVGPSSAKAYIREYPHHNPDDLRSNPMGDTWAIVSAADVLQPNPRPRKSGVKRKVGAYALFVKAHIRPYLNRGMKVTDAMKAVAGEWRAKKAAAARPNPKGRARKNSRRSR